jgi:hypothetical protein
VWLVRTLSDTGQVRGYGPISIYLVSIETMLVTYQCFPRAEAEARHNTKPRTREQLLRAGSPSRYNLPRRVYVHAQPVSKRHVNITGYESAIEFPTLDLHLVAQ